MKKYLFFAAISAALVVASCAKEVSNIDENTAEAVETFTVEFDAAPIQTRTYFGDKSGTKYPVLWNDADKIAASLNLDNPISCTVEERSADFTSAKFSGTFSGTAPYTFYAVYPLSASKSLNKANQTVLVEIPGMQTPTATGPDGNAQILYAKTEAGNSLPSSLSLNFSHVTGYFHMSITNYEAELSANSASFLGVSVSYDDAPIAGRLFYHVDTDVLGVSESAMLNTISINTSGLANLDNVWCALAPVDLSSKSITVAISTDKGSISKVVNMPAAANLTAGKVAKFTVDMSGVSLTPPVVYKAVTSVDQLNYGDKVILAAAGVDQAYAMSTGQNTNNRSAAGVTKTADEIIDPSDVVEILQLEDGTIPGHYAFRATGAENPGYIYAGNPESSGSNILKTKNTKDNSASWAVSIGNVTVSETTWEKAAIIFADIPSTGRGLIRFNANDKLFSAYGNGSSQEAVKLYRLDEPATPHFNATLPNGENTSSAAQDVTVYVWGNVAWTAEKTGEGASLNVTSGTGNAILTLSVPENTSSASTKAYSVTVTTTAAVGTQSYTLNITQAKAGGPEVGDILFWEYFDGATNLQGPAAYLSSGNATTTVYGGASVTYTSAKGGGNTRAYVNDNVVYDGDFATYLPSSVTQETNMMVGMSGGWWKIAGIPCKGVATAFLVYDSNNVPDANRNVTSPTDGVSIGDVSYDTYRSTANDKAIRHIKYTITFDPSKNLETFDLQFNNNHTSNIRVANVKLTVLTLN